MLRGQISRIGLIVCRVRPLPAMLFSVSKRPISIHNLFKPSKWSLTRGSTATLGQKHRGFYSSPMFQVSSTPLNGFSHKYQAWYFFAIPVFIFSFWEIVYKMQNQTAMVSWPGKDHHLNRAIVYSLFYGCAAHNLSSSLLNANMLSGLVNTPISSTVSIAAQIFAKGYVTGFVFCLTWTLFLCCLNLQHKSRKNKASDSAVYELAHTTYKTAVCLFVSSFPIYLLGALFGSPLFVLLNRSHWMKQISGLAEGTKRML